MHPTCGIRSAKLRFLCLEYSPYNEHCRCPTHRQVTQHVRRLFYAQNCKKMIRESYSPRTLTWILTAIQIFSPIAVALYSVLPCILGAEHNYLLKFTWVLRELLFTILLPFLLLSFFFIPLNKLPSLRKLNKLSLKLALILAGLITFLSLPIAALSPIYSNMGATSFCLGLIGASAFFGPANWVYYVSFLSVALAILISVRVIKEVRAA